METRFAFAVRTAAARAHTQDRAAVFEHADALIVVVADGAGGVGDGSIASEAVLDAVRAKVGERSFDPYDVRAWSGALTSTDERLARGERTETTAIVVVLGPHLLAGVSVGDSEAWIFSRQRDVLTEDQPRARVGTGRSRPKAFYRRTFDGVLVVATDGLFKHASVEAIEASCSARSATAIAESLIVLPRLRSGAYPDDVAVVVVETGCASPR